MKSSSIHCALDLTDRHTNTNDSRSLSLCCALALSCASLAH